MAIRASRRDPVQRNGHSELFQKTALRRKDSRPARKDDQHSLGRGVVQRGPSDLDLFQLPEDLTAEVLDCSLSGRFDRIFVELAVELPPSELQRTPDCKGSVVEPEVEIEAQGATLEGFQDVHIERHRMLDDLVEELLAQLDLALPQHAIIGPLGVPPELMYIRNQ